MSTVDIERTKLTANFFNSVASGTVLASLVAPFIGMALGTLAVGDWTNVIGLSCLGTVLAVVVHLLARRLLLSLED